MKISLVLISYNRKDDIKKSIESMLAQTTKPDEIIVVDNNSADGTKEMVMKNFPKVKLIILPGNEGLCFAANVGFKNSQGKYVGIVESDMTLSKNWIEEVIKAFEKNPEVGIACPYFLHWSKYGWVDCEFETQDDYLFMTNGCFAVRRDMIEKAGQNLYDSAYFLYAQEEELTARVFNLGYKIKRLRTAMTFHKPSVSKGRVKNKVWYFYNMRNNFWNLWTFYSLSNVMVFTPMYLSLLFIQVKNPIRALYYFGKTLTGIPHCLKKRQVVNKDRYLNSFANYKHIRKVQKTHHPFDWATGEIHPYYKDKIVASLNKEFR
jgi:hypothetical protein